jgi:hypothetical protein
MATKELLKRIGIDRKHFLTNYYNELILEKNKLVAVCTFHNFDKTFLNERKNMFRDGLYIEIITNKFLRFSRLPAVTGPLCVIGTQDPSFDNFVRKLSKYKIDNIHYFLINNKYLLPQSNKFAKLLSASNIYPITYQIILKQYTKIFANLVLLNNILVITFRKLLTGLLSK